jgi:hypothetical protein
VTRYDYSIHPLADLFPELPAKEFDELKQDIQKNGQLEPIVISREHLLLDGRHRMKACRELAITPRTIYFDDVPHIGKMSEADFIWSKNILRRQLTDGQRAAIAHKWSDAEREAAKQRQKAGVKPPPGESAQRSRDAIARKAQVSTHTVRQVEAIAKRDPKARDDVAAGKKSLRQAAREVLRRAIAQDRAKSKSKRAERTTAVVVHVEPHEPRPETNVHVEVEPAPPTPPEEPTISDFLRKETLQTIAAWNMEETGRQCFALTLACTKHLHPSHRILVYFYLVGELNREGAFEESKPPTQ